MSHSRTWSGSINGKSNEAFSVGRSWIEIASTTPVFHQPPIANNSGIVVRPSAVEIFGDEKIWHPQSIGFAIRYIYLPSSVPVAIYSSIWKFSSINDSQPMSVIEQLVHPDGSKLKFYGTWRFELGEYSSNEYSSTSSNGRQAADARSLSSSNSTYPTIPDSRPVDPNPLQGVAEDVFDQFALTNNDDAPLFFPPIRDLKSSPFSRRTRLLPASPLRISARDLPPLKEVSSSNGSSMESSDTSPSESPPKFSPRSYLFKPIGFDAPKPASPDSMMIRNTLLPPSPTTSTEDLSRDPVIGAILIGRYELQAKIGQGSFGITYRAWDKHRSQWVAIKTIDLSRYKDRSNIPSIEDEIKTLEYLSRGENGISPAYIVKYRDFLLVDREELISPRGIMSSRLDLIPGSDPIYCIITDYVDGPSLKQFIDRNRSPDSGEITLARESIKGLFLQLVLGVESIHRRGFAHRDIKPANIVMDSSHTIKYIDFGLSCVAECKYAGCTNICRGQPGTMHYAPPESFASTKTEFLRFDLEGGLEVVDSDLTIAQAHDIWSLGIVMYSILNSRKYPFEYLHPGTEIPLENWVVRNNIYRGIILPSAYSNDYPDNRLNRFVDSLLIRNWEHRPTITIVINRFLMDVMAKIDV